MMPNPSAEAHLFIPEQGRQSANNSSPLWKPHHFQPQCDQFLSLRVHSSDGGDSQPSPNRDPEEVVFNPDAPDFGQINIPRVSTFGYFGGPTAAAFNSYQFSDDVVLQRGHILSNWAEIHRYHTDTFYKFQHGRRVVIQQPGKFSACPGWNRRLKLQTLAKSDPGKPPFKAFWRQTLLGFYVNDRTGSVQTSELISDSAMNSARSSTTSTEETFLADPLRDTEPTVGSYLDHNPSLRNLSPRLGISWSPGTGGNTSVRAGFRNLLRPILALCDQYL